MDARLGRNIPGRNARFAGKEQLQNERSIAVCRARVSKTVSKSTHPTASGPPRSSGDLEAGLEKNIPARMPPAGSLLRSTVNSPPSPPRIAVPRSDAARPGCSFLEQIPDQVRDDSVWLLRKGPISSFRQSPWSESRYYCFTALLDERRTAQRSTSFS